LVENCKIERKILHELPPPQPIVEQPIIPDIPFVQKLPAKRFFKANPKKDSFTIDEARTVIHGTNREAEIPYTPNERRLARPRRL
jgi:hypothetical protein